WPVPSDTVSRVRSINAGLAIWTVTPGSTAPDVSFTTPAMVAPPWADTVVGTTKKQVRTPKAFNNLRMIGLLAREHGPRLRKEGFFIRDTRTPYTQARSTASSKLVGWT